MNKEERETLCPVCGYILGNKPRDYYGNETCPCCCIEFDFDDNPLASGVNGTKEEIYEAWRKKWINRGMKFSCGTPPPNWDPIEQLARLGINIENIL